MEQFTFPRHPESHQTHVSEMYRGIMSFTDHYPNMYEQEVKKLQDCKLSSVVPGIISNIARREIILTQTHINTSSVPGTDDYTERGQMNLLHSISQTGPIFLQTELSIPNLPLAVFATQLKLDGQLELEVSFDVTGGSPKTSYKVHQSHSPDTECPEGCVIVDLKYYIDQINNVADNVSLATSANYTHHFFRRFVKTIVCDHGSLLGSSFFDANLQFPLGSASANTKALIASWPTILTDLNQKIAQKQRLSGEDVDTFVQYVDSVLTTSIEAESLKDTFNLEIEVAEEISTLAREHQLNLNQNADKCKQMPSQVTMVKVESNLENKEEAARIFKSFLDFMEVRILCLQEDELNLDVETWLINIEDEPGFKINIVEDHIHLTLPQQSKFVIPFEKETNDLIDSHGFTTFQAIYHRALAFSKVSSLEIVLRSEMMIDAFVKPYNPSFLLAAKSPVTSVFIGENQNAAILRIKCGQEQTKFSPGDPLEKYEGTHKQISLLEAIWRYDRHKLFSISNIKPVYTNIMKERKLKFKKATNNNHTHHFKDQLDKMWYELFEDSYDKYCKKANTSGKICFYDFLSWYGKLGNREDIDEEDTDDEEKDDPEEMPFMAICNDDWNGMEEVLPRKMVLKNDEVFIRRKRSKKKLISFPVISDDPDQVMFRELVLFKHHESKDEFENLTATEIRNLFNEQDVFPEVNGDGDCLSKIQTIKQRVNRSMFDITFDVTDCESEFVKIYFDY
jgi:hypothetical protein